MVGGEVLNRVIGNEISPVDVDLIPFPPSFTTTARIISQYNAGSVYHLTFFQLLDSSAADIHYSARERALNILAASLIQDKDETVVIPCIAGGFEKRNMAGSGVDSPLQSFVRCVNSGIFSGKSCTCLCLYICAIVVKLLICVYCVS